MRHFITAQNTACGANAPHKILAAALHAARDAARGGGSALHTARDAACGGSSAPPTTRDTPCGVWTIPELHGEQHSADSHWVRNDLAAALWCRIEPPPSLRRSSTLHASSSSKPPNKKTGRDPNGSRPVSRCGLCRWQGGVAPAATAPTRRPRQQHPRDAIASAAPAHPCPRQQHPRGAIASAAPARPCPRPRGLKAVTARRCRRS